MEHGSHEARVFKAVDPHNGTLQSELMVCSIIFAYAITCVEYTECSNFIYGTLGL